MFISFYLGREIMKVFVLLIVRTRNFVTFT
jgi:hypothetical protein